MTNPDQHTTVASTDFKVGQFAMHGQVKLTTDGNILLYESTGPFNIETIKAFTAARASIHLKLDASKPYAAIVHWRNSALMPLDAFAAYQDGYVKFLRENQRPCALAWASGPEVEGMDFMIARFTKVFDEHGINFKCFATTAEARSWVDTYNINSGS